MIGKILKTMRRKRNLSQEQIAKITGFAHNTISQYENDVLNPTFDTIEQIANECGYKILFVDEENNEVLSTSNIDRKEI